ncbi:MAG: hypothetical protein Q4P06_09505 [Actinomycetaceae bacterium]|nr:hypothetical protein [Actinomycetaceae bacterium]
MRNIAVLLVSTTGYFAGAWLFFAIFQNCKEQDQRSFVIFLLMPIAYVCFTIIVLLLNRHIIEIRAAHTLHFSLGAFIGLSAFLFSLDGFGSLARIDSFTQLLSQFSIPTIGALVTGGVALGFGIFTQAPHIEQD